MTTEKQKKIYQKHSFSWQLLKPAIGGVLISEQPPQFIKKLVFWLWCRVANQKEFRARIFFSGFAGFWTKSHRHHPGITYALKNSSLTLFKATSTQNIWALDKKWKGFVLHTLWKTKDCDYQSKDDLHQTLTEKKLLSFIEIWCFFIGPPRSNLRANFAQQGIWWQWQRWKNTKKTQKNFGLPLAKLSLIKPSNRTLRSIVYIPWSL